MNKIEENKSKSGWAKNVEKEMDDTIEYNQRVFGVVILIIAFLAIIFFINHQMGSTGFFTTKFGMVEMIMMYGYLIAVMISGTLFGVLGRKHLSRYFDALGGMLFAAVAITWLLVVFPFEFTHFADVLPDFLRFLAQWISKDIARVVMVIGILVHLVGQVWMGLLFVYVRKAQQKNLTNSEQMKNGGRIDGE